VFELEDATKIEVLFWVPRVLDSIKGNPHLNVTISLWKPKKTNKQLGILFRAAEYFIKAQHGFFVNTVEEGEKRLLVQGLIDRYGNKKPSGLKVKNKYGEEVDQLVEIPLSQINRFEDFDVIFNGLFFVEAPSQGVDMGPFVKEWENYKKREKEEKKDDGSTSKSTKKSQCDRGDI
jgi:hypothetical protein